MIDVEIRTTFVSEVAKLGFADAASEAEALIGRSLLAGPYQLSVTGVAQSYGDDSTVSLVGSLRRRSWMSRPFAVEIVLQPWSTKLTEVGIRPVSHLGAVESMRTHRFVRAAREVLTELIGHLSESQQETEPATETAALSSAA